MAKTNHGNTCHGNYQKITQYIVIQQKWSVIIKGKPSNESRYATMLQWFSWANTKTCTQCKQVAMLLQVPQAQSFSYTRLWYRFYLMRPVISSQLCALFSTSRSNTMTITAELVPKHLNVKLDLWSVKLETAAVGFLHSQFTQLKCHLHLHTYINTYMYTYICFTYFTNCTLSVGN